MGDFLSGVMGTNSAVGVNGQNPYTAIQPWQDVSGGLSQQYVNEAAGKGPNPAQLQYQQNANNIAQQQAQSYAQNRALNPGLAARQAGNTGANVQQNAASGAGVQQAQQQLAAQQQLGQLSVGNQGAINQASGINANVAGGNQQAAGALAGGVLSGLGSMMTMAHGGRVPHYADGSPDGVYSENGPTSSLGNSLAGNPTKPIAAQPAAQPAANPMEAPSGGNFDALSKGMASIIGGAGKKLKGGSPSDGDSSKKSSPFSGLGEGANSSSMTDSADQISTDAAAGIGGSSAGAAAALYKGGMPRQNYDGGGMSSLMSLAPLLMLAANKGGEVPKMATGGALGSNIGKMGSGNFGDFAKGAGSLGVASAAVPAAAGIAGGGVGAAGGMAGGGMGMMGAPMGMQQMQGMQGGMGGGGGMGMMAKGGEVPRQNFDGGGMSSLMSLAPLLMLAANKGGKVPALVSPGEKYLKPQEAEQVAKKEASPKEVGKNIPGKAEVKGDSEKNDKVKANLDEGGVVIPRSLMQSGDESKIQSFVANAMREHGKKASKIPEKDFKGALQRAIAGRKNK